MYILISCTETNILAFCRNSTVKNRSIMVALKWNFVLVCLKGLPENSLKRKACSYESWEWVGRESVITFVIKQFLTNNLSNS